MVPPPACDPYVRTIRSPRTGAGGELATGWQDSAFPSDHRAWSIGLELRRRLSNRFGIVGRVDRSTGRDAGLDVDGDGRDDAATGPITRVSALAGPSVILSTAHAERVARYVELDVIAGYARTASQSGEDGLVVGADLSYQLAAVRLGLRALQGTTGDTREARTVLAHFGVVVGAGPNLGYGAGCGRTESTSSGWALAFDLPLSGYALGTGLGYLAPGFALEGVYRAHAHFQAVVRGDLLVFPNGDADRVLHQTLLAGARFDLTPISDSSVRNGASFVVLAGYALAAATEPTRAGSGPVLDVALGYGSQGDDGAGFVRLHGRFGMTPDTADLRAVFLSAGLELRLDRRRWRTRSGEP